MENPFSTNAYYLLGLPVSADQSEIKKKARLISAQLGIGETALESDFTTIKVDRSEDSLRDAIQRLSSPVKKIQEAYLWFSDENLNELAKISNVDNLGEIYTYLSKHSEQKSKWNTKRDFALFLTQLLFFKKANKKYLKESLVLWHELISSESAWKYFDLYYKNIDDINTNDSAFMGLRAWADHTISDIYSQLSEKWDDLEYTQLYTKTFGKIGAHTQKSVLAPRTKQINDAIGDLTSIRWPDGSPSPDNLRDIKKSIGIIQDALNALIVANLYEESEVIVLRDKASDAIRGLAIDLTNKYNDYERSAQILAIAEEISGTQSTKNRNQNDKSTVEENIIAQRFQVPVLELINKGKYLEAVDYVKHQIKLNLGKHKELKILEIQLTAVIGRNITETRSVAMDKINKGDFSGAVSMFEDLREYIIDNIDRFDLIRDKVDEMVADIDERSKIVNRAVFDALAKERDEVVKKLYEKNDDSTSVGVFMCLLDCAYYVPLGKFLKISASKNQVLNILFMIGWLTVWINGIGLIFLIPTYIWQRMEVKYVRE